MVVLSATAPERLFFGRSGKECPMNSPQQDEKMPRQMLRLKDVVKLCGLSKSQIMEHARHGAFPRPIKLTDRGRTLVFFQDEIVDWQTARSAQRRWCGGDE